jgi:hypothetical protein
VAKKNKADIMSQPLQGKANISFVINQTFVEEKPKFDFHWSPGSQEIVRQFQVKCMEEFGGRRASLVLDALVQHWLAGKIKVTL